MEKQKGRPTSVFISYSQHESTVHTRWVKDLAQRLQNDGIDCVLDQDQDSPAEQWPAWCESSIRNADYVLLVCSQQYNKCTIDKVAPGEGRGVKFEWKILLNEFYYNDSKNKRIIPVLFNEADQQFIPAPIKGSQFYALTLQSENVYLKLKHRLLKQGEESKLQNLESEADKIPDGMQFLRSNEKGYKEYLWKKDNSILISIPAGSFWMGSGRGEGAGNECPQRRIYLNHYFIDKHSISNKQFDLFVHETRHKTDAKEIYKYGYVADSLGNWTKRKGEFWLTYYSAETENHPVVHVTPKDALAYCEWAGKRLLTEAEWEKATRGDDTRMYPWGDTLRLGKKVPANFKGIRGGTAEVSSYPEGASFYGCLNMAGNVWEWCSDYYDESYYDDPDRPYENPTGPLSGSRYINRGGSWFDDFCSLRCASRRGDDPLPYFHVGFRCALSLNHIPSLMNRDESGEG
jgi:iron(II)-dependent oxidoreductase